MDNTTNHKIDASKVIITMQSNSSRIILDSQSANDITLTVDCGYAMIENKDGSDFSDLIDREAAIDVFDGGTLVTKAQIECVSEGLEQGHLGKIYKGDEESIADQIGVEDINNIDYADHDNSLDQHVHLANALSDKDEAFKAIAVLKACGMDSYADSLETLVAHSIAHVTAQEAVN